MNKINAEKTKDMVIIGLMAAIICVMGPLSIRLPFTLVPISLTNLAIYFICSRNQTHCYQLSDLSFNRNVRCTGIF